MECKGIERGELEGSSDPPSFGRSKNGINTFLPLLKFNLNRPLMPTYHLIQSQLPPEQFQTLFPMILLQHWKVPM